MNEEKVEVAGRRGIGAAILLWQALVNAGESLALRFVDSGNWLGSLTLSRDADAAEDDPRFYVDGILFQGDKPVNVGFVCEPDGRVGVPILNPRGLIFTDDADLLSEEGATVSDAAIIGGLCEDGAVVSRENAKKSKRVDADKLSAGRKLAQRAEEAALTWFRVVDSKLVEQDPSGDVWPRRMPKPDRPVPSMTTRGAKRPTDGRVVKRSASGAVTPV